MDNLGYPMPEGMLEAQLRYLEEKGFLQVQKRRGFGFEIAFASLTAKGWDLLDGMASERGVDERL
jgi:DNA-binding HxlR family transcriptional regulator